VGWSERLSTTLGLTRGDAQLYTHVVVMNRAQSEDGVWLDVGLRGMFRPWLGLSEVYNGVLSDVLTQSLGWGWKSIRRLHFRSRSTKLSASPESCRRRSRPGRQPSRSQRTR